MVYVDRAFGDGPYELSPGVPSITNSKQMQKIFIYGINKKQQNQPDKFKS
jgi:hypothetical protein